MGALTGRPHRGNSPVAGQTRSGSSKLLFRLGKPPIFLMPSIARSPGLFENAQRSVCQSRLPSACVLPDVQPFPPRLGDTPSQPRRRHAQLCLWTAAATVISKRFATMSTSTRFALDSSGPKRACSPSPGAACPGISPLRNTVLHESAPIDCSAPTGFQHDLPAERLESWHPPQRVHTASGVEEENQNARRKVNLQD
jgi:hypothetical protein